MGRSAILTVGVPQLPKPVVTVGVETASTAPITWTVSSATGIGSFQYRLDGGSEVAIPSSTGSTRSYTIPGLTASTTYTVQVRALPANGLTHSPSDWSDAATITTLAAPVPQQRRPGPVRNLAAVGSRTAVTFTMDLPAASTDGLDSAEEIEWSANGTSGWTSMGASRSLSVAGAAGATIRRWFRGVNTTPDPDLPALAADYRNAQASVLVPPPPTDPDDPRRTR